jgi:hypothetical protein
MTVKRFTTTIRGARTRIASHRRVRVIENGTRYFSPHTEAATRREWTEATSVLVSIDIDAIVRQLAESARANSSGSATTMHGAIRAKVTSRVETDVKVVDLPISAGYEVAPAREQKAEEVSQS